MKNLIMLAVVVSMGLSAVGQESTIKHRFFNSLSQRNELTNKDLNLNRPDYHQQSQGKLQNIQLKNGVLKQRLDSAVYPLNSREEYLYDSNNKIKEISYLDWDNGKWTNFDKTEYKWDTNGNIIQEMIYEWNNSKWDTIRRYELTYNAQGKIAVETGFSRENNQWQKSYKYEVAYNSAGNIKTTVFYMAMEPENTWLEISREEYSYDEQGRKTQYLGYGLDGDQMIQEYMYKYSYDSSGNLILQTEEQWMENQWTMIGKHEHAYNENGSIKESIYYYRNYETGELENREEEKYFYDNAGNLILHDTYVDDVKNSSEEMIFDDYGNRTEHIFSSYNYEKSQLIPEWKNEYVYDNSYSFEDLILPFIPQDMEDLPDIPLIFNHKLIQTSSYENLGSGLELLNRFDVYYSEQSFTAIQELESGKTFRYYPNPAQNQLTFEFNPEVRQFYIECFNAQGKKIISQTNENNHTIAIDFLPDGLYIFRCIANSKMYSGKFLVDN